MPVFAIEVSNLSPDAEPQLLDHVELRKVPSERQMLRVGKRVLVVRRVEEFAGGDVTGVDGYIIADARVSKSS